jgi:hypothetical protein
MSSPSIDQPTDVGGSPSNRRRVLGAVIVFMLLVQVLFGLSYIGAFHDPRPDGIPVGVVAPATTVAEQAAIRLEEDSGGAFATSVVASEDAAREQIDDHDLDAALVVGQTGDRLLIASAAGASQADLVVAAIQAAEQAQGRTLEVIDVAPLPDSDPRGNVPFYLMLVWLIGGYMGALLIGVVSPPLRSVRDAARRIGLLAGYSVLSASALTLLVRGAFDVGGGSEWAVVAVGSLISFAVAMFTTGLQSLIGIAAGGVVLLLFVVLGSPSSGGAVTEHLLPPFWRAIGPWLVNGAGVSSLREVLYFGGNTLGQPLLVLVGFMVLGAALLAVSILRGARSATPTEAGAGVAAGGTIAAV